MIVLLIAALAVVALLVAGGSKIARSRARERQRRERLNSARRAAAAASRAEQERRAMAEASDALTSVIPAIRLPWPTQLPGTAAHDGGYAAFRSDYPAFSELAPFHSKEEPAGYEAAEHEAGHGGDGRGRDGFRGEHPAPPGHAGEYGPSAGNPRTRAGQGNHRGGHAKRRRG